MTGLKQASPSNKHCFLFHSDWISTVLQYVATSKYRGFQKSDHNVTLKLASAIFYQICIFQQMTVLQKLWKMVFISTRKLISFSRYSKFLYFRLPLFFYHVSNCFRGWSQKNLKVYGVIICLNKNLITRFVWHLEKEIRGDIETLFIDNVLIM